MKNILYSLILLLSLSCTRTDEDFEPQTITPVLIGKGYLNSNTFYTRENKVIINDSEWKVLLKNFNSITTNITDTFTETNIDFNSFQIIVIIDNNNSSTSVDITRIIENTNTVDVTIQNLQLGLTQDVGHPFYIVKIPKSLKPIVFVLKASNKI